MSTYLDVPARGTHGRIGRKLQIHITDRQYEGLRRESARSGLPMAELIRRAVDATYRPGSGFAVRGMQVSLDVWRDPDAAVAGKRLRRRPR
jgi:hypothetical protein